MALYTLPKNLHPDFAEPRRKPVGAVEIDWDNPIAKDLLHSFIGNRGVVGKSTELITLSSTAITKNGSYYSIPEAPYISFPTTLAGSSEFTVVFRLRRTGGNANGAYVGTDASYNDSLFIAYDGAGTDTQVWVDSSKILAANTAIGTGWVTLAVTGSVANSRTALFRDGVLDQESATSTSVGTGFSNIQIGKGATFGAALDIEYLHIWDRAIPDSAVLDIYENPYQILKPAVPMTYFTAAAAPPAGASQQYYYYEMLMQGSGL